MRGRGRGRGRGSSGGRGGPIGGFDMWRDATEELGLDQKTANSMIVSVAFLCFCIFF